jgi:hypothetical protein
MVLVAWILGSLDWISLYPRFYVLYCPVEAEALRRADPPYRESYEMSNWFIISQVILNWNRSEGLIGKAAVADVDAAAADDDKR